LDAYLIAEAHRAERGVCACGRPLPCIAAQRAAEIMAETTRAAREVEAVTEARRAFSEAITQDLPVIQVEPHFPHQRRPVQSERATGSWPVVTPAARTPYEG
jgi:hypothetical protein